MSTTKKRPSGNPSEQASRGGPREQLDEAVVQRVVRFLRGQRDEARRRNEPEVWARYEFETHVQVRTANNVITPGLGRVPSDVMEAALVRLASEA